MKGGISHCQDTVLYLGLWHASRSFAANKNRERVKSFHSIARGSRATLWGKTAVVECEVMTLYMQYDVTNDLQRVSTRILY